MFSGIVETQSRVLSARREGGLLSIEVEKPQTFNDLSIGDSIAVNGVCLTVERFDESRIVFALGAETLKVTGWNEEFFDRIPVNLERSLRMGDRIHGHMVAGHVDAVGVVKSVQDLGGSVQVDIRAPEQILRYVWPKGSWAMNGVSLTINSVADGTVSVCMIPETLRRTNLGGLSEGDKVTLEADMFARGMVSFLEKTRNAT